jgi:hypothetical protein
MAVLSSELVKPYSYVRSLKQETTTMAEPHHAQSIDWGQVAAYAFGVFGLKESLPKLWGWLAKAFETEAAKRAKREEREEMERKLERSDMIAFLKVTVEDQKKRMDDQSEQIKSQYAINENLRRQVNELILLVGKNSEQIDRVERKANASIAINNPEVIERMIQQSGGSSNEQT